MNETYVNILWLMLQKFWHALMLLLKHDNDLQNSTGKTSCKNSDHLKHSQHKIIFLILVCWHTLTVQWSYMMSLRRVLGKKYISTSWGLFSAHCCLLIPPHFFFFGSQEKKMEPYNSARPWNFHSASTLNSQSNCWIIQKRYKIQV